MQEKLVITGMGAVTPIGIGVDTYWNNLVDGKCGIDHITRFDASELPVQIAAQVKDFNPDDFMTKKQSREMDLFMQYGYAAATEALADAGIEEDTVASDRMGVVVGTAMSGVSIIAETQDGLSTGAHKKVSPRFVPKFIGNIAAAQIAIAKGYHGPSLTVSTACSSGASGCHNRSHAAPCRRSRRGHRSRRRCQHLPGRSLRTGFRPRTQHKQRRSAARQPSI